MLHLASAVLVITVLGRLLFPTLLMEQQETSVLLAISVRWDQTSPDLALRPLT